MGQISTAFLQSDLRNATCQFGCRAFPPQGNKRSGPTHLPLRAQYFPAVLTAASVLERSGEAESKPRALVMSAVLTMTALGAALSKSAISNHWSRPQPRVGRTALSVRAAGTGTSVTTETSTRTNAKVVISQTKLGEIRYSFGTPPDPRPGMYHSPEPTPDESKEEMRRYAVLDCEGGMAATGLILMKGHDDLLTVARVYPGGTAEGMLLPGDVILACSVVVMLENDDGDFVPDFRWHDAVESSAEHTLGILMTHDGELRLRVCRNYQPRMEKAILGAWRELVPTTVSRNIPETWSRLLYKKKDKKKADNEKVDTSIGGIWSGLFTVGAGRDVRGDARRCWSEVISTSEQVTETKGKKWTEMAETPDVPARVHPKVAPEREVVCVLAEAEIEEEEADEDEEEVETAVETDADDEAEEEEAEEEVEEEVVAVAEEATVEEAEEEEEEEETAEEPEEPGKTWEEFEVTLDCTAGVNMTGLQFAQREDGLLRVSVSKPGGTAAKKVKLNDVLLATTYVVMVPDPTGERRAGIPELEWMDAVNAGNSFNTLQEAMLTHSQEMKLKLARGDVPLGALSKTASEPQRPETVENLVHAAQQRNMDAERATEMARKSMRAAASAGSDVPDDIKAWAAQIAAEARASRK